MFRKYSFHKMSAMFKSTLVFFQSLNFKATTPFNLCDHFKPVPAGPRRSPHGPQWASSQAPLPLSPAPHSRRLPRPLCDTGKQLRWRAELSPLRRTRPRVAFRSASLSSRLCSAGGGRLPGHSGRTPRTPGSQLPPNRRSFSLKRGF